MITHCLEYEEPSEFSFDEINEIKDIMIEFINKIGRIILP